MPLGSETAINLVANFKDNGLSRAERSIEQVTKALQGHAAANIASTEATERNARAQNELAGSTGSASSGLAALQAQLASTTAAQQALESSTGDLEDTLEDLGGDAKLDTIDAITEGLSGNVDELENLNEVDIDILSDYDENELRSFVELIGGVSDDLDGLMESRELPFSPDDIDEIGLTLASLDDDQVAKFRQLFGSESTGGQEDLSLTPSGHEDSVFTPETDYLLSQLDGVESLSDVVGEDPEDLKQRIRDRFGAGDGENIAEAMGLADDIAVDEVPESSQSAFPDSVGRDLGRAGIASPFSLYQMSDDELRSAQQEMEGYLGDLSPDEVREAIQRHLANAEGRDLGPTTRELRSQLDNYDVSNIGDPETSGPLASFQGLVEDNDTLRQLVNTSTVETPEDLWRIISESSAADEADLLKRARSGDLSSSLGDLSGFADNVSTMDDVQGFQDAIEENIDLGRRDENGNVELAGLQREILSNAIGDMTSIMPGSQQGYDVPVAQETLELELLQEMLESENAERTTAIQNLLEKVYTGEFGEMDTLFDNNELVNQQFNESLSDYTPDQFGREESAIISRQFAAQDAPMTQFLGEDSPYKISDVVDNALDSMDIDGDRETAMTEITGAVDQAMRDTLLRVGSQASPGVFQGLNGSGMTIDDITPDRDVVRGYRREYGSNANRRLSPARLEQVMASLSESERAAVLGDGDTDISEMEISDAQYKAIQNHIERVTDATESFRDVQEKSAVLRGGSGDSAFGGRRRRRGIFGVILQSAPGALSALDSVTQSVGVLDKRLDRASNLRKINDTLESMADGFKTLNPMLEATSLNLGPLNLNFTSFAGVLSRITALIGPLAVGLVGLAGAAGAAAVAFGSFVGVGAIGFLEQMEQQMAGVNNKQEALEELTGTLRDLAMDALSPLQNATLADGSSGIDVFINTIRASLVLLNRFATAMAAVVGMPVFVEQISRLADALLGRGEDANLIENLQRATEIGLPVVVDMLIGLITNLDDLIAYGAEVGAMISNALLPALVELQSAIALLISYGSGYITVLLTFVAAIGIVINEFSEMVDIFASFVGADSQEVIAAFGGMYAAVQLFGKGTAVAATRTKLLNSTLFRTVGLAVVLYNAYKALSSSQQSFGDKATENRGIIASLSANLLELGIAAFGVYSAFGWLKKAFGALKSSRIVVWLGSKFKYLTTVIGALTGVSLSGWVSGLTSALTGLISGISGVTAGFIGVIAVIVDFFYYLATGESLITSVAEKLEEMTGINFGPLKTLGDLFERAYRYAAALGQKVGQLADRMQFSNIPIIGDLRGAQLGVNDFQSALGTRPFENTSRATGRAQYQITVDASRSDRDLARKVRKEIDARERRQLNNGA